MTASFDRVVIVDWSAHSTPKSGKDSIWAAEVDVASQHLRSVNLRTRRDALRLLEHAAGHDGRVLIGVDFSLGFPAGTAAAFGLGLPSWSAMWNELAALVVDDDRNRNNRFEVASTLNARSGHSAGPFWGCPPSKANSFLTTTKRSCDPLPEWRAVEMLLRSQGNRPFSAWQLTGAGAVGSQSLLGIAAMHRLVESISATGRSVDVWPFTTGVALPQADVVIVEVWPTLVELPDASGDPWDVRVRDQLQVETLATHFATRDLTDSFTPSVGPDAIEPVVDEEGWVFGVV